MNTDYKKCSCGEDCYMHDDSDEQAVRPCWGDVITVDELCWGDDYSWVHACRGHTNYYLDGVYREIT